MLTVKDVRRHLGEERIADGAGTVPERLLRRLSAETEKIVSVGHLAPWIFVNTKWAFPEEPYRSSAALAAWHLANAADLLLENEAGAAMDCAGKEFARGIGVNVLCYHRPYMPD
jgi:hypothetical protein